ALRRATADAVLPGYSCWPVTPASAARPVADSQGENGFSQYQVGSTLRLRHLTAEGADSGFQLRTTDLASTGDKAGSVIAGSTHHFHIADGRGGIRGEIEGAIQRTHDDIAGRNQGLCLGRRTEQGNGGYGTEQDRMH